MTSGLKGLAAVTVTVLAVCGLLAWSAGFLTIGRESGDPSADDVEDATLWCTSVNELVHDRPFSRLVAETASGELGEGSKDSILYLWALGTASAPAAVRTELASVLDYMGTPGHGPVPDRSGLEPPHAEARLLDDYLERAECAA